MEISTIIQETVNERMRDLGMTNVQLAGLMHKDVGLSKTTLPEYVGKVRHGHERHYIPAKPDNKSTTDRENKMKLKKLSFMLHYLGVKENDDVISRMKQAYPPFVFPPNITPAMDLKQGIEKLAPEDQIWIANIIEKTIKGYQNQ